MSYLKCVNLGPPDFTAVQAAGFSPHFAHHCVSSERKTRQIEVFVRRRRGQSSLRRRGRCAVCIAPRRRIQKTSPPTHYISRGGIVCSNCSAVRFAEHIRDDGRKQPQLEQAVRRQANTDRPRNSAVIKAMITGSAPGAQDRVEMVRSWAETAEFVLSESRVNRTVCSGILLKLPHAEK